MPRHLITSGSTFEREIGYSSAVVVDRANRSRAKSAENFIA